MPGDRKVVKLVVLGMIILGYTGLLIADEKEVKTKEPRPEERNSIIPDDTFSPTESVSEDYPVPFPTDI